MSEAARTTVGINVRIPVRVHRAAKVACAAAGLTWDEAVTEALEAFARAKAPLASDARGRR